MSSLTALSGNKRVEGPYQRKWFDTGKSVTVRHRFLNELQPQNCKPLGTRMAGSTRPSANVLAFELEVRECLSLVRVSQLAQKPQFHIPRNCLIRRVPNSRLRLPTNTC